MARIPTRTTDMRGIDVPIVHAPMGGIARGRLASAVSEAGGHGIIDDGVARFHQTTTPLAGYGATP